MFLKLFCLISFSKPIEDWKDSIIEPVLAGFCIENIQVFYLIAINKFQNTFTKQELNLLIWAFEERIHEEQVIDSDDFILTLDRARKSRFNFKIENTFTGGHASINEEGVAKVGTPFKIMNKQLIAEFLPITTNTTFLISFVYEDKSHPPILRDNKKLTGYMNSLEEKRMKDILMMGGIIAGGVIILIGSVICYCCFCKSKK